MHFFPRHNCIWQYPVVITAKCAMANFTVALECEEECNSDSSDISSDLARSSSLMQAERGQATRRTEGRANNRAELISVVIVHLLIIMHEERGD